MAQHLGHATRPDIGLPFVVAAQQLKAFRLEVLPLPGSEPTKSGKSKPCSVRIPRSLSSKMRRRWKLQIGHVADPRACEQLTAVGQG